MEFTYLIHSRIGSRRIHVSFHSKTLPPFSFVSSNKNILQLIVYTCIGAKSTQRLPRPASATSRSSVSALHSFFLHHLPYNQRAIANHSYPGIVPLAMMSIKKGRPSSHLFLLPSSRQEGGLWRWCMFSQCWWSPAHQEIWASTRHTLPTSRFFVVLSADASEAETLAVRSVNRWHASLKEISVYSRVVCGVELSL